MLPILAQTNIQFAIVGQNLTNDIQCAATALNKDVMVRSGRNVRFEKLLIDGPCRVSGRGRASARRRIAPTGQWTAFIRKLVDALGLEPRTR